MTIPHIMISEL